MPEKRTRRGRPKGSGIDDRQRLDAIARLITSNPALKPTTAIRSLGVSDPSVIRRLRDKFNAVRSELMRDVENAATSATTSSARKTPVSAPRARRVASHKRPAGADCAHPSDTSKTPRARSIAASAQKAVTRISAVAEIAKATGAAQQPPARSAARQSSSPSKPRTPVGDDDAEHLPARSVLPTETTEMFTTIFSAGVAATNTLMAAHTTLANEFFRSPYMSLALRQQLAFSEWAVGFVPIFQFPTKTAT